MPISYALDATARTIDTDGRMHIDRSHISKANVRPYYGREIPKYETLGLSPDKVYQLLLAPEELEKGAPTFARNQLLSKHVPVTLYETMDAQELKKLIVGTLGSDIEFNDPYLDADLCVWDAAAIAGIETNTVREISCAYHYIPVMTPGVYKGESYDGIMTNIRGNHACMVEAGRAGSDVLAADSKPREFMKMTKLGKALFVALGTAFPKLAQDSTLPTLVGQATKKTFNRPDVRAKLLAMDAAAPAEQVDAVMDALLDVDEPEAKEPKTAKDGEEETEEEKKEREKREKTAKDKAAKDEEKDKAAKDEEKQKTAMDSLRRELREEEDARRAVRPVVGDVIAQDSAAEIYGFALDHMKVGREGVTGVPALKALFNLASSHTATVAPRIAQDSAGLATKFPGAARFRQA